MKRFFIIFLSVFFMILSACSTNSPDNTETTLKNNNTETTLKNNNTEISDNTTTENVTIEITGNDIVVTTTPETTEITTQKIEQLPLPNENTEFIFQSGAGAWRTEMTVNRDGNFFGLHLDSEMGSVGDGYPKGSAYICNFTGRFVNIEKLNDYTYQMELSNLRTQESEGTEWIEDEIMYIASFPYGLCDSYENSECTDFILYLPDTPVDSVPEEFLYWWPYRYDQSTNPKSTLSCYGILNVATNDGFFFTE